MASGRERDLTRLVVAEGSDLSPQRLHLVRDPGKMRLAVGQRAELRHHAQPLNRVAFGGHHAASRESQTKSATAVARPWSLSNGMARTS